VGKSPKKSQLFIWVDEEWNDHPKLAELREMGHLVVVRGTYPIGKPDHFSVNPDLVLSKSAHMWSDEMWPLLDVTMKAARARKKGLPTDDSQD
jgi:hypothetical protein